MCKMDKEVMEILRKVANMDTIRPGMDDTRICLICRRKFWMCEASRDSNECAGRMARRVLARMEKK